MSIDNDIHFNDYHCHSDALLEALIFLIDEGKALLSVKSEISRERFEVFDLILQMGIHAVQIKLKDNCPDLHPSMFIEVKSYVLNILAHETEGLIFVEDTISYFEKEWESYTTSLLELKSSSTEYSKIYSYQMASFHTICSLNEFKSNMNKAV